ncbi:BRO family, N-terminal domain [Azotobacter beijerinckii]|uniref:BRO family, N-terminal domain n=1 Tax=Azotobacter beijerinckii TaxID=170623 RepID=A0A1H6QQY9_9GAMM|nr:BRO family protein [Azotobacter beijerinckii]SEI41655.1 BRO family, N-terminal domain [Azotobacter beijerinckii]
MQSLVFHHTQFEIVDRNGQPWLQAAQIAKALGYAREDAISRIYSRNADEFTPCMSETVNLTVSGNLQKEVRIFSLRGAHLLAMFARTDVAKEFRRWVLDVLEGRVEIHGSRKLASELDLSYPVERWLGSNPLYARYHLDPGSVFITADMFFDQRSPTLTVLAELKRAGYDVEACYLEVQGMRHHLEVSRDFMRALHQRSGEALSQGMRVKRW